MFGTCFASMEAAPRRLLLGAYTVAVLMAIAIANAGSGEAASVIGLAKCADCTRKNVNAEAAFNGLKVAIKCKNSNGEYESKAVGELQTSGAFSVPVSVNPADCVAQLHNAAGTPCPGQEPSRITPLSDGTFVAVPGNKRQASSAVCASVTICGTATKYFHDHFHKKEDKPEPSMPKPEPKPEPEHQPPTPMYGSPPTPIYPATHRHLTDDHLNKDHELEHFFDHFHKKPVVPPKPEPQPKPQPENQPPTPTNDGSPTPGSDHAPHTFGHHHHHFFDYFHKKPVPPEPKPEPKPEPEHQTPTPTYGSPPAPIYHPPAMHRHLTEHLHKDHELEHFFDHFHKKPVVPPKPEPQPKPQPENQPPTPTYGSATPTNGSPSPGSDHAPHMFGHYYKGHHHHHFFDYFHKKPVPPEPKPEPKPQPENNPTVPTFGSPPPIYTLPRSSIESALLP